MGGHEGQGDADEEGAEGGDSAGEALGASGLTFRHDHRHLLEGRGVSNTCEEEHGEHAHEEGREVGGVICCHEDPAAP